MALPDQPISTATPPGQPTDLPTAIAELISRGERLTSDPGFRIRTHGHQCHDIVPLALLFVLFVASLTGLFVGLHLVGESGAATAACLSPAQRDLAYVRSALTLDPCSRDLNEVRLPQRS
jgi:hypothetical protein